MRLIRNRREWPGVCLRCAAGVWCRKHAVVPCAWGGCGRLAPSGRFCPTHYQRLRDGSDVPVREYGRKECGSCGGRHYAKGLCRRCYRRAKTPPRVDA